MNTLTVTYASKKIRLIQRVCVLFALAVFTFSAHCHAADANSSAGIYPTRVVIPKNQKSGSVTLRNTSSVEISYRMNVIEMGLDSNGQFRQLSDHELPDNHNSSKPLVRFSPRQVRLKPGQSQVVRVIVRRSAIKGSGEYRSHLVLQALPFLSESLTSNLNSDPVLVHAAAGINVGVSIPLIVRHGDTDAQVTTQSVTLKSKNNTEFDSVSLLMNLEGNQSAYGDFAVFLVDGKTEKRIGRLKSWALYYPYPQERVRVPVKLRKSDINPNSKIRVVFYNQSIDNEKSTWVDTTLTPVVQ